MSYTEAPATKMLATNCAACGTPLLDAVSIEVGLGPDCRDRYGWNVEVAEDLRTQANAIVHKVALLRTSKENLHGTAAKEVMDGAEALRLLGFDVLADRMLKGCVAVRIEEEDGALVVRAPYNEASTGAWRSLRCRPFDKERKANIVSARSKRALMDLLRTYYPGMPALGPKGVFLIPEGSSPAAREEE